MLLLAAAVCLLGPATDAVAAKKKVKKLTLTTVTAAATAATTGLVSATATCPKGTKALGGGLTMQPPLSSSDFLNPLESRRIGTNAWRVSAYRLDAMSNGPAMSITAEAYCRGGRYKAKERTDSQSVLDSAVSAIPIATCPVGKAAGGGGFSITPPTNANDFHSALSTSMMTGSVGWLLRSLKLGAPPLSAATFTSHVYCLKRGQKGPRPVGGATALPAPVLGTATAVTAPCSAKRNATAGGFRFPDVIEGPVVLLTESRRVGRGWQVAASRLSGAQAATIEAFGYCS
jgi:hypothetical protein